MSAMRCLTFLLICLVTVLVTVALADERRAEDAASRSAVLKALEGLDGKGPVGLSFSIRRDFATPAGIQLFGTLTFPDAFKGNFKVDTGEQGDIAIEQKQISRNSKAPSSSENFPGWRRPSFLAASSLWTVLREVVLLPSATISLKEGTGSSTVRYAIQASGENLLDIFRRQTGYEIESFMPFSAMDAPKGLREYNWNNLG